ncbi:MAG TPA: NADP-dependent oxidoreductase [Ignavibacteriaceae bacterium]|nr:NADP-dependent oxidoreductase [Ignavibacteriaceae bacterium]
MKEEGIMQQQNNRQILLIKRPAGMPDESCFKLVTSSIPQPINGQVLLRTRYISVDPYMRGRMNDRKSYVPPYQLNEVMNGGVVGEVIESKSNNFVNGDFLVGNLGWQDYSIAGEKEVRKINPEIAPITTALGVLGMPGLTAYFGLLEIGQPQQNETVVVSGAAGAVGTIVGQIAKIHGCRVVGIAGSDKKTKYLIDELGFDNAINYRTIPNLKQALMGACPDGVDIYFDNVGGEISDAVLSLINNNARIPLCGQISLYNETQIPVGPRIQPQLLTHSALMKGFIVSNYTDRFEDGIRLLAHWIREKKLKYSEDIIHGLENTPKAFIGLFMGENLGKQLVKVS